MAIDLNSIKRGGSDRKPITLIHSPPGKGKTTFGASAPNPIFLPTEDGLGTLEPDSFPELGSWEEVQDALAALYDDHDYQTVVVDSLSALEPLIWKRVARDEQKDSIEQIGYGRGYTMALDYWREFMEAIKGLANNGMNVVLIAHTDIVKFDGPDTEPYDRYQIKLHKRAFQFLYEQCDVIGFVNDPVYVKKQDQKDHKGKGVKKGSRKLHLQEKPAFIAKNRYSMPESIDFPEEGAWDVFAQYLPK